MKTLGKLKINTEKVLKSEELVNLRGGYYTDCWSSYPYQCWCDGVFKGCVPSGSFCANLC